MGTGPRVLVRLDRCAGVSMGKGDAMTKHELLGRLSLLLGAAAHLPEKTNVLGYSPSRSDHDGLPTIFVEGLADLPPGEQSVRHDRVWTEHSVMCRGVKVYCYEPRREKQ